MIVEEKLDREKFLLDGRTSSNNETQQQENFTEKNFVTENKNTQNVRQNRSGRESAGFSQNSDEEIQECEIIINEPSQFVEQKELHCQLIQQPIPIIDKPYSLQPDMIFGWLPKNFTYNGPIPLTFESSINNAIIHQLHQNRMNDKYPHFQLAYIGQRLHNTLKMHESFSGKPNSYNFQYDHLYNAPSGCSQMTPFFQSFYKSHQVNFQPPFKGQNPNYVFSQGKLEFDSQFQSGNLDLAVQVGENQYDLYMRVDSNTRGHLLWYYFQVKNMKQGQRVQFNICNFSKGKSLYERGMKPYIYSAKEGEFYSKDWHQEGENVEYEVKQFRFSFIDDYVDSQRDFCCLSFHYQFKFDNDEVSFAYCIPYTYSQLVNYVQDLFFQHSQSGKNFALEEKLCTSLSGLDVPLLTITDYDDTAMEIQQRKVILISGRIHPGESNGSWVMHGFLEYIFSDNASEIRQTTIFKIIPMLNPDGVILGNYRTGVAGRDLNREFNNADQLLFPTVFALKELVSDMKRDYGANLIVFLDLHGHSVKQNIFMYGPEYPIFDINYFQSRMLPKLLSERSQMFRYFSCIFKISPSQKNTARAMIFNMYEIPNCFTIETSNGSYYNADKQQTIEFASKDWIDFGNLLGSSLTEFIGQMIACEKQISNQIADKLRKTQTGYFKSSSNFTPTNANCVASVKGNNIEFSDQDRGLADDSDNDIVEQNKTPQATVCGENNGANVTNKQGSLKSGKRSSFSLESNQKQRDSSNPKNLQNNIQSGKTALDQKNPKQKDDSRQGNENNEIDDNLLNNFDMAELGEILKDVIYVEQNRQVLEKEEKQDEKISEGGSDSESEEEDFDRNHLKSLQKEILQSAEVFSDMYSQLNVPNGNSDENQNPANKLSISALLQKQKQNPNSRTQGRVASNSSQSQYEKNLQNIKITQRGIIVSQNEERNRPNTSSGLHRKKQPEIQLKFDDALNDTTKLNNTSTLNYNYLKSGNNQNGSSKIRPHSSQFQGNILNIQNLNKFYLPEEMIAGDRDDTLNTEITDISNIMPKNQDFSVTQHNSSFRPADAYSRYSRAVNLIGTQYYTRNRQQNQNQFQNNNISYSIQPVNGNALNFINFQTKLPRQNQGGKNQDEYDSQQNTSLVQIIQQMNELEQKYLNEENEALGLHIYHQQNIQLDLQNDNSTDKQNIYYQNNSNHLVQQFVEHERFSNNLVINQTHDLIQLSKNKNFLGSFEEGDQLNSRDEKSGNEIKNQLSHWNGVRGRQQHQRTIPSNIGNNNENNRSSYLSNQQLHSGQNSPLKVTEPGSPFQELQCNSSNNQATFTGNHELLSKSNFSSNSNNQQQSSYNYEKSTISHLNYNKQMPISENQSNQFNSINYATKGHQFSDPQAINNVTDDYNINNSTNIKSLNTAINKDIQKNLIADCVSQYENSPERTPNQQGKLQKNRSIIDRDYKYNSDSNSLLLNQIPRQNVSGPQSFYLINSNQQRVYGNQQFYRSKSPIEFNSYSQFQQEILKVANAPLNSFTQKRDAHNSETSNPSFHHTSLSVNQYSKLRPSIQINNNFVHKDDIFKSQNNYPAAFYSMKKHFVQQKIQDFKQQRSVPISTIFHNPHALSQNTSIHFVQSSN